MTIAQKNSFGDVIDGLGGAGKMAFHILFHPLLKKRDWWGTTEEERERSYPGDELVTNPKVAYTHAIEINAPLQAVWPWVVQIGQGRGGFYSYTFLENMVGCQIYNTNQVLPEYQDLENIPGIRLHPAMGPLRISHYSPGAYFVLHGSTDLSMNTKEKKGNDAAENFLNTTWLFYLSETENGQTRLISRWRADFPNRRGLKILYGAPLTGSIAHVMDIKMLHGIKKRAEKG